MNGSLKLKEIFNLCHKYANNCIKLDESESSSTSTAKTAKTMRTFEFQKN